MTDAASPGFAATVCLPVEELGGSSVEVDGEVYRHLFRARRLAVGDRLRAVDGAGRAREAVVARIGRRTAQLDLEGALATPAPHRRVVLVVAPPRPERASWLVEKASELGVVAVRWLRSERAPRSYGKATIERQRRVAVAGMQQAGGALLPEISGPHDWSELATLLAATEAACVLDPEGGALPESFSPPSVTVLAGPEGGWTEAERRRLDEAAPVRWSLGTRILRIETAALVASGCLLQGSAPPSAA